MRPAKPEVYELEAEGICYAIRLAADQLLHQQIGFLLNQTVGRPPRKPVASYATFRYQAKDLPSAPERRIMAFSTRQFGISNQEVDRASAELPR